MKMSSPRGGPPAETGAAHEGGASLRDGMRRRRPPPSAEIPAKSAGVGGLGGQARQNRPAGLMSAASGARQSAVYPSPDQGTDADRRPARGPRQGAAPARAPSAAAPPRCRRVCRPRACVLADVAPAVAAESAPKAQAYCLRSGPVGSRWGARREKAPRNRPPRKLRKQAVSGPPQVRPPRSRRPPAEIFEAL